MIEDLIRAKEVVRLGLPSETSGRHQVVALIDRLVRHLEATKGSPRTCRACNQIPAQLCGPCHFDSLERGLKTLAGSIEAREREAFASGMRHADTIWLNRDKELMDGEVSWEVLQEANKSGPDTRLLERDRLWCAALVKGAGDSKIVEAVTKAFNESRPDVPPKGSVS